MALRPEIAIAIGTHPYRDVTTRWRHDPVGIVMTELLARSARLAKIITPDETVTVMNKLAAAVGEHTSEQIRIGNTKNGEDDVRVGGRDIYYRGDRWYSSVDIPGLHEHRKMPRQPMAHVEALQQINALLAERGIKAQVLRAERMPVSYREDFETTLLTVRCPERRGEYELTGQYAHTPADHRLEISSKHARVIAARILERRRIQAERLHAEAEVAKLIADVEGMKVVGSYYSIETYRRNIGPNPSPHQLPGTAYAEVEAIDDRLLRTTIRMGLPRIDENGKDDSLQHRRSQIARHRANLRRLGDQGQEDALTCEPILAAALRDAKPEYARELVDEIEAVLAGRGKIPANPRRRGINGFSMTKGMLSAPVSLGRKARFTKERVNIQTITQLPQTLIDALPGRPLREVVDHPWLEGLEVQTIMVNSKGLQIRPKRLETPVPLVPVIEALRSKIPGDAQ